MPQSARVIVITGAGSGIGRATAARFAEAGCRLVVNDLLEPALHETVGMIDGSAADVTAKVGDVADRRVVEAMFNEARERLGPIDVLVANAGVYYERPLLETTDDELERTLAVNVKGVFLCGQAAARAMIADRHPGHIVNLASTFSEVSDLNCAAYCASKGAVRMLTKAMAVELGPHGIHVNAVAPGEIRSGMNPLDDPDYVRGVEAGIPLRRIGLPRDVASVIYFLASEDADYVQGDTVFVDGGFVLRSRALQPP